MTIRPALPSDVPSISRIESDSFSNPWQPDTFASLLRREDGVRFLVAEEDGAVIGYAVLWWVLDQGELANLAVQELYQGKGVGSQLLDQVISHAEAVGVESLFLEVRKSNEKAHGLYSRRGFIQISVREGYYQNPREDARILVKYLPSQNSADPQENSGAAGKSPGNPTVRIP